MSESPQVQAWIAANLPDLSGKRALVTGGAGGLGFETAAGLAHKGAQIIVADINAQGGEAAAQKILASGGSAEFLALDLADLSAIRGFAQQFNARGQPLDILINNAGILPPLQRRTTRDGFELKFGINVLGHFALTSLLLPSLRASAAARVVWVSSLVHARAKLDFDDLQSERDYLHQRVYDQAKLACLVLAMELQERSRAHGWNLSSLAAHPGIARTGLGDSRRSQQRTRLVDHLADIGFWFAMRWLSQDQALGALSILRAAAAADAVGGEFYGPDGFGEFAGMPKRVQVSPPARDPAVRQRLWQECERLTGVSYA